MTIELKVNLQGIGISPNDQTGCTITDQVFRLDLAAGLENLASAESERLMALQRKGECLL
jgi:hypothetical protein